MFIEELARCCAGYSDDMALANPETKVATLLLGFRGTGLPESPVSNVSGHGRLEFETEFLTKVER